MGSIRTGAPYLAMVVVQLAYAGNTILTKLALENGLHNIVFIVYRHLIATLLLGSLAYILERKQCPQLSWSILGKIFLLALFGITINQTVFYEGLEYSSATVAGALSNVVPAVTFLLAVLLRMEKVELGTVKGKAKIIGSAVSIGGALVFTFWKSYLLKGLIDRPLVVVHAHQKHVKEDWVKGSSLIITANIAYCVWLILQAKICEVFKAKLSMNTIICFFGLLQSSALALIYERKIDSWRLGWNIQLLAILYCGIIISGLVYYLQTWSIAMKGPVFASMFFPMMLVFVAIFSATFLAERLHFGSIVGMVLIISGLYCFLWGKSKELVEEAKNVHLHSDGGQDYAKSHLPQSREETF